jgi:hypothetical protein
MTKHTELLSYIEQYNNILEQIDRVKRNTPLLDYRFGEFKNNRLCERAVKHDKDYTWDYEDVIRKEYELNALYAQAYQVWKKAKVELDKFEADDRSLFRKAVDYITKSTEKMTEEQKPTYTTIDVNTTLDEMGWYK